MARNVFFHPRFLEQMIEKLGDDAAAAHEFRKQADRWFFQMIYLSLCLLPIGAALGWALTEAHYAALLHPGDDGYWHIALRVAAFMGGGGVMIAGLVFTQYAVKKSQEITANVVMSVGIALALSAFVPFLPY